MLYSCIQTLWPDYEYPFLRKRHTSRKPVLYSRIQTLWSEYEYPFLRKDTHQENQCTHVPCANQLYMYGCTIICTIILNHTCIYIQSHTQSYIHTHIIEQNTHTYNHTFLTYPFISIDKCI